MSYNCLKFKPKEWCFHLKINMKFNIFPIPPIYILADTLNRYNIYDISRFMQIILFFLEFC